MRTSRERLIAFIVLIAISLAMIPLMSFCLGAGESAGESWKIFPRKNEQSVYGESVVLHIEDMVDSIYVKIGNVYSVDSKSQIVFTIDSSNSATELEDTSAYSPLQRKNLSLQFEKDGKYLANWYKLGEKLSIGTKYVRLTTKQSFELCEVVFLDKDGKQIKTEVYGGFEWKGNSRSFVLAKDGENSGFAAVCDGQSCFALDRMHMLSDREASIAGAAQNLVDGTAYYVSDSASPLSVALYALSIKVFGNTPFAIRLISFLFAVATFYTIFFFAEKMFGSRLGIWAIVFWLLSGTGIAFAGFATATSIGIFFVVLSLTFAYEFFTSIVHGKNHSGYIRPLLLAGAFSAIAVAADFYAIVFLPATLILSLISVIKNVGSLKKEYVSNEGLEKEYAREVYVSVLTRSVIGLIAVYIVFPLLSLLFGYGIGYPLYSAYYGDKGIFGVAFANISNILKEKSFSLGYLVGISSESYSGMTSFSFITNKALTVAALVLLVLTVCLSIFAKLKKLKNIELGGSMILNFDKTMFLAISFVVCLAMVLVLGGDYAVLCYSFIPLTLVLPHSIGIYENKANRAVYGIALTLGLAVVIIFFLLSSPVLLKIDLPTQIAKYVYGWLL